MHSLRRSSKLTYKIRLQYCALVGILLIEAATKGALGFNGLKKTSLVYMNVLLDEIYSFD